MALVPRRSGVSPRHLDKVAGEPPAHAQPRPVEARLDRRDRDPEDPGHFLGPQSLDVPQDEHGPLIGRQRGDRVLQRRPCLLATEQLVRPAAPILDRLVPVDTGCRRLIPVRRCLKAGFAAFLQASMRGDGVEPRGDGCTSSECVRVLKRGQKRLLEDIFSIVTLATHPGREPEYAIPVLDKQPFERRNIALLDPL